MQRARPISTFTNRFYGMTEYNVETAFVRTRKVWATLGPYAPNLLGYTRSAMVETIGSNFERRSKSIKLYLSLD